MGYGAQENLKLPAPSSEAVWWVVRPKFSFVEQDVDGVKMMFRWSFEQFPCDTCYVLAKSWFDARLEGSVCLNLEYAEITVEPERK